MYHAPILCTAFCIPEATGTSGDHQCFSSKNAHGIVIIKLVNFFSNDFSVFPFPDARRRKPGRLLVVKDGVLGVVGDVLGD